MNKQEYEERKYECWLETANVCGIPVRDAKARQGFDNAFARAYDLGKQAGSSEQLTAEGEGMLMISRSTVQNYYRDYKCARDSCGDEETDIWYSFTGRLLMLEMLFGTKCRQDEVSEVKPSLSEQKPAEPKFKEGDWVKATCSGNKCHIGQIIATHIDDGDIFYQIEGAGGRLFLEKNVEPYNILISQNPPENCDTEKHISTGDNTSQKSEVLMKITSRSQITISIIQVKDKGAQV